MATYLITGASDGIGRVLAESLNGNDLVLLGRDAAKLAPIASALGARHLAADLAHPASAAEAVRALGIASLDGLVHSAGISDRARIEDADEEHWARQFAINLFSPVAVTRVLLPALRAASGTVVFVNSVAALAGVGSGGATYAASKSALRSFAQQLRVEEPGIRVGSVYPGRVATEMQRALREYEGGPFEPERYAPAADVAAAVRSVLEAPAAVSLNDVTVVPRAQ